MWSCKASVLTVFIFNKLFICQYIPKLCGNQFLYGGRFASNPKANVEKYFPCLKFAVHKEFTFVQQNLQERDIPPTAQRNRKYKKKKSTSADRSTKSSIHFTKANVY